MRRREFITLVGAVAAWPFGARAQTVDKLVRIIVGFPAGGGTDIVARLFAQTIQGHYAASIIVEDKPGASARLAVEYVKNALPDGSVMLFTPDFPMTLYPHSFKSLNYDPVNDFVAVGPAAKGMLAFSIGPALPDSVKTLSGFIQWCKEDPAKASYATTSAGATPHFIGVMLAAESGVAMTPVHYRGGAPALQDLLGGHVPASVNPVSEVLEVSKAGSVRILAVTGVTQHADVQGARLQRRRRILDRRLAAGPHARRHRARLERRNARGVRVEGDGGGACQIRHRADIPAACRIRRDGQIRDRPVGTRREGVGLCCAGLNRSRDDRLRLMTPFEPLMQMDHQRHGEQRRRQVDDRDRDEGGDEQAADIDGRSMALA